MSDKGDKKWDVRNLMVMDASLGKINVYLSGKLKSLVGGATFTLKEQDITEGAFHGWTNTIHTEPTGVKFFTIGPQAIRQMNIYHEVGHLLDNVPGTWDVFTNAVTKEENPSWVVDKIINRNALNSPWIIDDLNYNYVQALQTYSNQGPSEQWADAFANYIACNIDFTKGSGMAMYIFVYGALAPYIGLQ